jgi:cytidylate kinase
MEKKTIAIAIDGPAGAGKSTIARILANHLQYVYVDTGALYRTVGCYALENGVKAEETEKVVNLLNSLQVTIQFVKGEQHVFANGVDVTGKIRTPEVSMAASTVSAIPAVRQFLFDLQQNMAKINNVIMDGRDIGTVVLPWAQIKIFLTASPEARAKRRYLELIEKGQTVTYEDVLEDMKQRDYNDSHRAVAPLKPADDAILVDTSDNSLEESVEIMKTIVKERLECLNIL